MPSTLVVQAHAFGGRAWAMTFFTHWLCDPVKAPLLTSNIASVRTFVVGRGC
jgi:hypothetical protein